MKYNISHLKYFVDTAESESVQQAAQLNCVSQPAVSQGIKKLESQIDLNLMKHKKNTIELTKQGIAVLEASENLFLALKQFNSALDEIRGGNHGLVNIGVSNSLAKTFVFPKLKNLGKMKNLELNFRIGKTDEQIELLQKAKIDFGVTIENGNLKSFAKKTIKKGSFSLFGKAKCPHKIILTEARPETVFLKQHLATTRNIEFVVVESWDLIYHMVKNGYGVGWLPDFLVSQQDRLISYNSHFRAKTFPCDVVIFHPKAAQLNSAINTVLAELN